MTKPDFSNWIEKLKPHRERLEKQHTREMFATDPDRFLKYSLCLDEIVFDYSKNRIDEPAMAALFEMSRSLGVEAKRDAMFAGEKINTTENRAALHGALRGSVATDLEVDSVNISQTVAAVLAKMREFSDAVRSGQYSLTGGAITDVVNIGIGGSDLGPAMATQALALYHDGPNVHFVSNADYADLQSVLSTLNPATTLFIIASKTFTTFETILNAKSARAWLEAAIGDADVGKHFVALTSNLDAAAEFDIPAGRCFALWDWVGGRYSVWSAIGLSLMIAIGPQRFDAFLDGAKSADRHFCEQPLEVNIPVIMALLGIWYRNVWDYRSFAILPYDDRLQKLPAWLQQLDMESNGKSIGLEGERVEYATGPIIFGQSGTNGQHAFYQLLHQGKEIVPCDFLVASRAKGENDQHRLTLAANCIAQGEALMQGCTLEEAGNNPHRFFEGNRPSNTFVYDELTPKTLGTLLAFYEHKVFVQGVLWNINSFDQWGVELGKELATNTQAMLENGDASQAHNSSTQGLLRTILKFRE